MRVQSPVWGGPCSVLGDGNQDKAQAMASRQGLLIPKEIEAGSPSNGLVQNDLRLDMAVLGFK